MIVGQRAGTDRTYGTHRTYMKSRLRTCAGRYLRAVSLPQTYKSYRSYWSYTEARPQRAIWSLRGSLAPPNPSTSS